jgi:hypothetical protein
MGRLLRQAPDAGFSGTVGLVTCLWKDTIMAQAMLSQATLTQQNLPK